MYEMTIEQGVRNAIEKALPEAFEKALTKGCLIVERKAKENAPVSTGTLRSSITHEVDRTKQEGIIGTNLEYAPYVEIGTGIYSSKGDGRQDPWCYVTADGSFHWTQGSQPHPFLKPALDDSKSEIEQAFKGII